MTTTALTTTALRTMAHRARVGILFAAAAAAASLATGCGGGSPTANGPVTPDTATSARGSVAPSPTTDVAKAGKAGKAGKAKSDDAGRRFDLGSIVSVVEDQGVSVIIFDRWTAKGVSDSKLAAKGVAMSVHADARYQNLNSGNTFRIPVLDDAIFTYNHCVAVRTPPQQRSSTLKEFARLDATEEIMLLTLDPQGHVYKAENDPAC